MRVIEKVSYNPFASKPKVKLDMLELRATPDGVPERITSKYSSEAVPNGDFGEALFALTDEICEKLMIISGRAAFGFELREAKPRQICTGVHFSYVSDEHTGQLEPKPKGAMFSLLLPHTTFNSAVPLTTPYLSYHQIGNKKQKIMPVCVMQAAQTYLKEAENYLNGARAQGELFIDIDGEEQPPP